MGRLLASRLTGLLEHAGPSQQGPSQQGPSHDFLSTPLLSHGLSPVPRDSVGWDEEWDEEHFSSNARLVLDMFRHATKLHAPRTPPTPIPLPPPPPSQQQ